MCIKSTSVTVQTLNTSPQKIETELCISLLHFFIYKTYVPLFLFCGNAKRKSEHKKFWKRMEGVPPSLKLRRTRQENGGSRAKRQPTVPGRHVCRKRFFLPPRRQGAAYIVFSGAVRQNGRHATLPMREFLPEVSSVLCVPAAEQRAGQVHNAPDR